MNSNKKYIIYLTLLYPILLLGIEVYAQQNPHLINYNRAQYNANNKNWAISEDEKGIMYFGNNNGLLEFDGIEWRLNKIGNNLPVISVAAKSHEIIFTGSREEFGRWDRDISGVLVYTSLSRLIDKSLLYNDDFWRVYITPKAVFFQSFNSIYEYDYKSVKRVNTKLVYLLLSQIQGEFWVQQMRGGLFKATIGDDRFELIKDSEFLKDTDARIILPYPPNKFLIGTSDRGIYIYDGVNFKIWNDKFAEKDLNCGIYTSRGTYLWGTISDGLFETDLSGNIINHISSKNSLQNNTILGLYEDHSKNIWAALDKGITQINYLDNMSCYIDHTGYIGAVYDAKIWNDKLFLGTNQGVFFANVDDIMHSNNLSIMKLIDGTQGQVWSLDINNNNLISSSNKGLIRINKDLKTENIYNLNTGVFISKELNFKGKDLLFVCTYSGLKIIDKEKGIIFSSRQLDQPIKNIEIDHLNNIWIEHAYKGVYKCKINEDFSDYNDITYYGGNENADALPLKLKIFKVGGRIILFGENNYYIYDEAKMRVVKNDPLNECFSKLEEIIQIIHIKKEYYWALANNAIHKFKYDGSTSSIIESYDLKANNLLMISEDPNISILNDSVNLVCLDNGFLIYNNRTNKKEEKQQNLSVPHIEYFRINNINNDSEFIPLSKEIKIPYTYNTVTIKYGAKDILSKNLTIEYRLVGIDKNWITTQYTNIISYARLNQGNYTLEIRTVDNLGNASNPLSINFKILPPWYLSIWAYIFYIIFSFFLLLSIWFFITKYYKKQHIKKIRIWEAEQLKLRNEQLEKEVERKNAELFTQTSFILKKNEVILKLRDIVEEFFEKNKNKSIIPLHHDINAYLNNNLNSDEDWETFLIKFEEKHTSFFKKMKTLYPDLNKYDLRLCACLKLNLDTKEIASLMNLSIRGVESSRYRLRKKLNLDSSQNLNEFILTID